MLSDFQLLADGGKAGWAGLASTVGVDFSKVHPAFPTHPRRQREKLSKASINAVFTQHPSGQSLDVQVFCKNGLSLVAKWSELGRKADVLFSDQSLCDD